MGKMLDDAIAIQKMNGVYDHPISAVVRKMLADEEVKMTQNKTKKKSKKRSGKK